MLGTVTVYADAQNTLNSTEVKNVMRKVADWQIANPGKGNEHDDISWTNAVLYVGMTDWAELSDKEDKYDFYYQWMYRMGSRNQFQLGKWMYHADFIAVAQLYIDLYKKYGEERIMWHTWARTNWVMSNPANTTLKLDYSHLETLNRWSWCDALFMAPPVYAKLYALTKDKKYMEFMDKEYKATYEYLFDKDENLFYRDQRYFNKKEVNGQKIFWGRGNGWVLGGLCEILQVLPKKDSYRKFYEDLFIKMCKRVAELQGEDGCWRASMLDPEEYPSPEMSATGFMIYALAYGINEGILDKKTYLPNVINGWEAMTKAVDANGKLGYVQPIGADPKKVTAKMTEVYGVGAFLLAGCQIYKLCK